jgi:hypothetical protein
MRRLIEQVPRACWPSPRRLAQACCAAGFHCGLPERRGSPETAHSLVGVAGGGIGALQLLMALMAAKSAMITSRTQEQEASEQDGGLSGGL